MNELVWQHLKLCPRGNPDDTIADAALAVREGAIAWLGAAANYRLNMPLGRAKICAARG